MEKNISSKQSNAEQNEGFPKQLVVLLIVIVLGIIALGVKTFMSF
jgi:hypothetical protein